YVACYTSCPTSTRRCRAGLSSTISKEHPMSRLPPGPRSALLQTFAVARDPFGTFQRYARRYGAPFTLTLCTGPIVLTGTPTGLREIVTAPPQTFASNNAPVLSPLFGERSVFRLCGSAHSRVHTLSLHS